MPWWQIPLVVLVGAWGVYLYSTPSDKVMKHIAQLREWWKSRKS